VCQRTLSARLTTVRLHKVVIPDHIQIQWVDNWPFFMTVVVNGALIVFRSEVWRIGSCRHLSELIN
jgi:hypothetical protein